MNRNTANAKPTAKASKTSRAVPQDDNARSSLGFEQVMQRYRDAQEEMLRFFKAPTWKRTLCAFVTSVLVGAGVGWIAGTLLNWMVVGAVAMAAPLFLVVITYVLGFIVAVYYGGKLAGRIGGAVLTGEADERAAAAYDAIKSFCSKLNPFGAREIVVPAKAKAR